MISLQTPFGSQSGSLLTGAENFADDAFDDFKLLDFPIDDASLEQMFSPADSFEPPMTTSSTPVMQQSTRLLSRDERPRNRC